MPPRKKSPSSSRKTTTDTTRAPEEGPDPADTSTMANADPESDQDARDQHVEDGPVSDNVRTGSRTATVFGKTYVVPDYKSYSSSKINLEQPYY
jgi:hypothetical protein